MELWRPPIDGPHLLEWWRPLLLASRAARQAQIPWPIHPDEFVLSGRVDRSSRPPIWIYRHPEAGGELYLDPSGQAYKFTPTPKARSLGRFNPVPIRTAVWQARLPDAVEPVWYRDPSPAHSRCDDATHDVEPGQESTDAPTPRVHGHLRVYDGGRSLAG
jgi:hypothetical protein